MDKSTGELIATYERKWMRVSKARKAVDDLLDAGGMKRDARKEAMERSRKLSERYDIITNLLCELYRHTGLYPNAKTWMRDWQEAIKAKHPTEDVGATVYLD
jgi:hypothetical protein